MKQTHIIFVNSYCGRSFDLQNQKLMLRFMFIMIKSCSATLHRVNCFITGSYTSKKHTLSSWNQLKSFLFTSKSTWLNFLLDSLGFYNDAFLTLRKGFPKAVPIWQIHTREEKSDQGQKAVCPVRKVNKTGEGILGLFAAIHRCKWPYLLHVTLLIPMEKLFLVLCRVSLLCSLELQQIRVHRTVIFKSNWFSAIKLRISQVLKFIYLQAAKQHTVSWILGQFTLCCPMNMTPSYTTWEPINALLWKNFPKGSWWVTGSVLFRSDSGFHFVAAWSTRSY